MNLQELQTFVRIRYEEGLQEPAKFPIKMMEILRFIDEHHSSLSTEALAFVDKLMDGWAKMFEAGVQKLPDGQLRRQMNRQVALVSGTAVDTLGRSGDNCTLGASRAVSR